MPIRPWGPIFHKPGARSDIAISAAHGGGYVLAWAEGPLDDQVVKFQLFDATGVAAFDEVTTPVSGSQFKPSVTVQGDGNIYIVQQDFDTTTDHDVVGYVYDAAGSYVRTQIPASALDFERDPNVTNRDGNQTTVAYVKGEPYSICDVYFVTYDNNGNLTTPATPANQVSGDYYSPLYVNSGSAFASLLLWKENVSGINTLWGRLVGSSALAEQASYNDLSFTGRMDAAYCNATIAIVYSTDVDPGTNVSDGIAFKLTDLSGNPQGPDKVIAGSVLDPAFDPKVVTLSDDTLIVAWRSGSEIWMQEFTSQGVPNGGANIVASLEGVGNFISEYQMKVLADDRIIVSWAETQLIFGAVSGQSAVIVDPRDGVMTGSTSDDLIYGHNSVGDVFNGNWGNDTIHGLGGADTLYGGAGNDSLHGGRGDDTLYGGADQDSLLGGIGADEMDGGSGVDTANYALAAFAVTVSLDGTLEGTGEADGDVFVAIENLTGTNRAAQGDTLRGNAAANAIAGLAGADTLDGAAGHDRLTGGTGADTLTGGIGNDSFIYNTLTEGGDTITDFSSLAANNNDVFRFKGSVFGGLAAGGITNLQFQSSTADVAANTNIRFFYETDTRILRFDADGSDPGAAVVIATLQAGATMTFNDILMF